MAAPKTVATYDLNGSTREFDFAFDYLARSFVKVSLIGTERVVLQVGTDYTFVSANRIRTNVIYGAPDYQQIEIRRETSTTDRLVDFQDASILRADDLDLSQLQVLHVAEEAREAATETIGTNNFGHLDARGRRIVNVGDPVDEGDTLTLRYYTADRTGTYAAKQEAEAARDKAKEWASSPNAVAGTMRSSKTYAEQAASSATFSDQRATFSDQRATASAASAAFSDQRATASAASASESASSSAASLNARTISEEYAQKPVGTQVSTGGYSALHWASKAEEWALQAGEVPIAVHTLASAINQMYSQYIGVPIPWMSETLPAGYVPMDGRAVPSGCPVLLSRYPSGYLPDMRDYFIRGRPASGRALLSLEADGNKAHTHGASTGAGGAHTHTRGTMEIYGGGLHQTAFGYLTGAFAQTQGFGSHYGSGSSYGTLLYDFYASRAWSGETSLHAGHAHTVEVSASGDSQARPKNIAFMYICMTDAAIPELPTIGA